MNMDEGKDNLYAPNSLFSGPGVLYVSIAVLFVLYLQFGLPLIQLLTNADEQILFSYTLYALLISFFVLTVITTITHRNWSKQHWHVNLIIFILTGFLLTMIYVLK